MSHVRFELTSSDLQSEAITRFANGTCCTWSAGDHVRHRQLFSCQFDRDPGFEPGLKGPEPRVLPITLVPNGESAWSRTKLARGRRGYSPPGAPAPTLPKRKRRLGFPGALAWFLDFQILDEGLRGRVDGGLVLSAHRKDAPIAAALRGAFGRHMRVRGVHLRSFYDGMNQSNRQAVPGSRSFLGAPSGIRTRTASGLNGVTLPVGLPGRRCCERDSNPHWRRAQRRASSIGLPQLVSAPGVEPGNVEV